jgi:hypothetical protein
MEAFPCGIRAVGSRSGVNIKRFGDILIVLERDLEGGPHNTLLKFTLAFTKTYLGEKDA